MSPARMCRECLSYSCRCEPEAPDAPVEVCPATLTLWPTTPPSNGTATSDAAAESLSEQALTEQQRKILNALWRQFRECGATDELIQAVTGLSGNAERPRRGELVMSGWLECRFDDEGRTITHPTNSGRQAVVWFLTDKAIRAAEARRTDPEHGRAA